MKEIRIKPQEIEIPQDDPFKNDLLDRKHHVEIFTQLIGSFKDPCVLALNASWGTGKTTFIRMWAQHLRNENFPVVEFNSWETDFAGNPFVALCTELTDGLSEYKDKNEPLASNIEALKEGAKKIYPSLITSLVQLSPVGGIPMVKEAIQALLSENNLDEYRETKKSIKEFKNKLKDTAKELSKANKDRPLVIFIDELDRCRPSYAVELLEIAKHLFTADNIVFVLALNRTELAHSIKSLYGNDFDAGGYLRRFFDVDIQLPGPERSAFIQAMLGSIKISGLLTKKLKTGVKRWSICCLAFLIHLTLVFGPFRRPFIAWG